MHDKKIFFDTSTKYITNRQLVTFISTLESLYFGGTISKTTSLENSNTVASPLKAHMDEL